MVWSTRGFFRRSGLITAEQGSTIQVSKKGASYIQIVIYQKGYPVLIGYGRNGKAKLLLSRYQMNLQGAASFDCRAYNSRGSESILKGNFQII